MRSSTDRNASRLLELKVAQVRMARAAAIEQERQGAHRRHQADALRRQALETVERAIPLPEQGLTRTTLYDRLRTLAVARAHALELQQTAGELEGEASACAEQAQELTRQARAHQRKQSKLDHWQQRERQAQARQRQQRQYQHQLEDVSCRSRHPQ